MSEIDDLNAIWEREASLTSKLLRSIPADRIDFRPDPQGRSLGELAWHLAELEWIFSTMAQRRDLQGPPPPPQPKTVEEIASGYDQIHRDALARVRALKPEEMGLEFPFVTGESISVRSILRYPLLHHLIHHRGQLMMLIRLAKGVPSHVYGPNREDDAAVRREISSR